MIDRIVPLAWQSRWREKSSRIQSRTSRGAKFASMLQHPCSTYWLATGFMPSGRYAFNGTTPCLDGNRDRPCEFRPFGFNFTGTTTVLQVTARTAGSQRRFGGATLDSFRNERNIVARRPKAAQVAVKRAWHEAEHANVHQRDDPTWISSFPPRREAHPRIIETKQEHI